MEAWQRNRGCVYEHAFQQDLQHIGVGQIDFDAIAPMLDEVLCGITDDKLNGEYPTYGDSDIRIVVTDQSLNVPPLRIAFRVDDADGGKICYLRVDLRDDEDPFL